MPAVPLAESPRGDSRVGILTNPFSRSNLSRPRGPYRSEVLHEQVTQSLHDVPRALDRLLAEGTPAIAINGGDGTLGAAIAHLEDRGQLVPLIPVLGGTNNSVAKDTGGIGRIDRVAERLQLLGQDVLNAKVAERNTLRVTKIDPRGKETPLGVGFIFSTGLIVRFTEAYYAGPWYGPPQAARVVATQFAKLLFPNAETRRFWAFEQNRMHIDADELPLPNGVQLALVSTLDTQILFFKPFPKRATEVPGFNVLVNALPSRTIFRHLWPLSRGTYKGHGHWTTDAADFRMSGTEKVFLDGEALRCNPEDTLRVTPGPRVTFLQL
jgi:hypothetical protein